mmetsp:Transcript_83788/g.175291  ORF Transcript_83788/g.175291 Transcript_83788/m.175291 type:complete len:718 (+) Transcript_83788:91-2244(+)
MAAADKKDKSKEKDKKEKKNGKEKKEKEQEKEKLKQKEKEKEQAKANDKKDKKDKKEKKDGKVKDAKDSDKKLQAAQKEQERRRKEAEAVAAATAAAEKRKLEAAGKEDKGKKKAKKDKKTKRDKPVDQAVAEKNKAAGEDEKEKEKEKEGSDNEDDFLQTLMMGEDDDFNAVTQPIEEPGDMAESGSDEDSDDGSAEATLSAEAPIIRVADLELAAAAAAAAAAKDGPPVILSKEPSFQTLPLPLEPGERGQVSKDAAKMWASRSRNFGTAMTLYSEEDLDKFQAKQMEADQTSVAPEAQRWILSGGEDGCLRLWNLGESTCWQVLHGTGGPVRAVAADWTRFVALSGAGDGCRLWDLRRGRARRYLPGGQGGCTALAQSIHPSGACLGGYHDGSLHVWNLATGESRNSRSSAHRSEVLSVTVEWDRLRCHSMCERCCCVWKLQDWSLLQVVTDPGSSLRTSVLHWVDSDSFRVLLGGLWYGASDVGQDPRTLRLWRGTVRPPMDLFGSQDLVTAVRTDSNFSTAVSTGWDSCIRLWDVEKTRMTDYFECKQGRFHCMEADFDWQRVYCGSHSGRIFVYDWGTQQELHTFVGHAGPVLCMTAQFTPALQLAPAPVVSAATNGDAAGTDAAATAADNAEPVAISSAAVDSEPAALTAAAPAAAAPAEAPAAAPAAEGLLEDEEEPEVIFEPDENVEQGKPNEDAAAFGTAESAPAEE